MPSEPQTRASLVAIAGTVLVAGCGSSETPATPESATTEPAPIVSVAPEPQAPDTADVDSPATDRFPTFGVAFTPPPGWRNEDTTPQVGFLGRWLPPGDDPDDWRQFAIDVRPMLGDADQRAAMESSAIGALERAGYKRSDLVVDGVVATRLDAPPPPAGEDRTPRPSPVVIAQRSRLLYRTLFLLNDPSNTDPLDRLLSDWKWIEPEPVAGRLRVGTEQTLFDGLGRLTLPAITRIDPEFTKGDSAGFTIFDYHHGQDAIILVCERDLSPDPPVIREHVISYAELIERRTQLDRPLSFGALPGRPNVYASESLEGRFEERGQLVTRLCRYAVWRPRAGALVRIQAVINNEVFPNPADLAEAVAAVDAIFRSCSPLDGS